MLHLFIIRAGLGQRSTGLKKAGLKLGIIKTDQHLICLNVVAFVGQYLNNSSANLRSHINIAGLQCS